MRKMLTKARDENYSNKIFINAIQNFDFTMYIFLSCIAFTFKTVS